MAPLSLALIRQAGLNRRGGDRRLVSCRPIKAQYSVLGIGNHNQLADKVFCHEIGLRFMELGQPVDATDKRPDLAFLNIADYAAEIASRPL